MIPIAFLILALANWRIAHLLYSRHEGGPWNVLDKLREVIGVYYDEYGEMGGKNVVARAITCPWCLTPWVGLVQAATFYFWPTATIWLCLPFALSAAALLLHKAIGGD